MPIDIDALIAGQKAYLESIQPVDVPVAVGEKNLVVRVPFLMPTEFSNLAALHPPRPGVAADLSLWFSLDRLTRAMPNITLIDGDETDDLFRLRDKEAVYVWSEIYDALEPEDAQNVRMAVWALHIWEPEQRRAAVLEKKAKKEADNG
ncbi:hypothetical protein [Microbacterium sp. PI-1]|uniref:hypothetical protein n=1 Tax=Microbacterium sp. PI-1 TaxID=2545631 RepID=UPI0014054B26|nr:hypothetical protein [Microbacterium sp. PI-1]